MALAAAGPCWTVPGAGAGAGALPRGQLGFLGLAGGAWAGTRCSSPTGALFGAVSFWLSRVALPLAPGPWRGGEPVAQPQLLLAPPATTSLAPAQLPGGKSPSLPLGPAVTPGSGWRWPPCPSLHGAGAGNGIPKAAVPAAPSCPGVSLPALPPLPRHTCPPPRCRPTPGPAPGKSRLPHSNCSMGLGRCVRATRGGGGCWDEGSRVYSPLLQGRGLSSTLVSPTAKTSSSLPGDPLLG